MDRRVALGAAAVAFFVLQKDTLSAQSPLGSEFLVHEERQGAQSAPSLVYLHDGSLILAWLHQEVGGQGSVERRIEARRILSDGQVEPPWDLERGSVLPFLAGGFQRPGEYRLLSLQLNSFSPPLGISRVSRFSAFSGLPMEDSFTLGTHALSSATILPDGGLVIAWVDRELQVQGFSSDNQALTPPLFVPSGAATDARLAAMPDESVFAAIENSLFALDTDISLVHFTPAGELLTSQFQVNEFTEGHQAAPRIAASGTGPIVVWQSEFQHGGFDAIIARRFTPDGLPLGPEILVNVATRSSQSRPDVATDPHGNFVVVWHTLGAIFARLFNERGAPISGEIVVAKGQIPAGSARVAFGPEGAFAVVWQSFASDFVHGDVAARRFLASEGAESCFLHQGRLRCDAGHTGGSPELDLQVEALAGASAGFLADLDGDRRDDLCGRVGNRFLCDLDHQGQRAELDLAFGLASDAPLVGDVNGDGLDDLCVKRGSRVLCDTAHNGGGHELAMRFGFRTDTVLLGDLDGDGRDEPCVYRSNRFLCDLAHDGGAAELAIQFGFVGNIPLLADFDSDGTDDPCVVVVRPFSAADFLCDTAHDGGNAEVQFLLVGAGQPLLGNLDGL